MRITEIILTVLRLITSWINSNTLNLNFPRNISLKVTGTLINLTLLIGANLFIKILYLCLILKTRNLLMHTTILKDIKL